jgi:hypothetical protein
MKAAMLFILRSIYQFLRQRRLLRWFAPRPAPHDDTARRLLADVARNGFVVLPGYKSAEWCRTARAEIEGIEDSENSENSEGANAGAVTHTLEDARIFAAEKLSPCAAEFARDPVLLELASTYAGSDETVLFCMANHVVYRDGTYGSGGEWHRDGFRREMKALIYLTDVTERDGPFGYVRFSHLIGAMLLTSIRVVLRILKGETDITANRLKDTGLKLDAEAFVADAGTVILFDTCGIHTGHALKAGGERYALTNYYAESSKTEEVMAYYRQYVKLN